MADFSPVSLSLGQGTSYKTEKGSAKLQRSHIPSASWHRAVQAEGTVGAEGAGAGQLKEEAPSPPPLSTENDKNK